MEVSETRASMQPPEIFEPPLSEGGALSENEIKFEEFRQRAGFILAPVIFLALWFLPIPGLEDKIVAHHLLAILGLVVTLWISEAIPLAATALLGPALCVVFAIAPAKDIFKSFADPIIFLFIGSFLLAEGIYHHGLNRRIAFQILSLKIIGNSPTRLMLAFGCITAVFSMWISNTTTVAMMLPVGVSILSEMARRRSPQLGREVKYTDLKFGTGLMLIMMFAATVGGIATPVGTPPNLIAIGLIEKNAGVQIPFFKWMTFGLPLAFLMMTFLVIYLRRLFPGETDLLGESSHWILAEKAKCGLLSRGEKNVLIAFGFTVTLWLVPGICALILGANHEVSRFFSTRFPESTVALLGALLLFLLPINFRQRHFTLTWTEAKRIDWGTILLFGGGLALGDQMFSTGLAHWLGTGLVEVTHAHTTAGLVVLFSVIAAFMTQGASNTASTAMVVPVAIAVSQAAGVNPLQPALATGICAALGCMLPVSTPPNAIAYGSGSIPLMQMIKHGFVLTVVGIILTDAMVLWLVPLIFSGN